MLTICTFNIQNDIRNYNISKSNEIIDFLKKNEIDILNLQEVYSLIDKDLSKELNNLSYTITGTYRFYLKRLFNRINERTPIITNKNIIEYKTYHLPFLPSLLKRVMTKVVIEYEGKKISIYNTHLDYKYDLVKKRQLNKILNIIKNDNNSIILTGDFNLKNNKIIFNEFIDELNKLKIKHIDVKDKTLKQSNYHRAIDHIFLSDSFDVISYERITNLDISDHYPIILKIK